MFHRGINFNIAWTHIEMSDACNCSCIMCEQSGLLPWQPDPTTIHGTKKGFMGFELWKKILEDYRQMGVKWKEINPFWYGESLMNPEFTKMMRYLGEFNRKHKVFSVLQLHTNAVLLDKEKINAILEASQAFEFSKIFFSLDSIDKENYQRIRRGGDLDAAVKNVKAFIESKKALKYPKVILQFILMDANKQEALPFRKYWSEYLKKDFEVITHKEKEKVNAWNGNTLILFEFWQQGDPEKSAALFDEVFR